MISTDQKNLMGVRDLGNIYLDVGEMFIEFNCQDVCFRIKDVNFTASCSWREKKKKISPSPLPTPGHSSISVGGWLRNLTQFLRSSRSLFSEINAKRQRIITIPALNVIFPVYNSHGKGITMHQVLQITKNDGSGWGKTAIFLLQKARTSFWFK